MAGDWIKMRIGLADDPAVVKMAVALSVDEDMVVGKLHRLWSWADCHTTDGKASGISRQWIDQRLGVPGFSAAMEAVGWIEFPDGNVSFPRFDRHNGKSAKARAMDATRKRENRGVRTLSGSQPDKNRTREEKRREEKRHPPEEVSPPPAPVVEWSDIDQEVEAFITRWNGLPGAKPLSPRALPNDIRRAGFQSTWLNPTWRPVAERALQRLMKPLPRGPDGEVRQVSIRHFFEKQSTIQELADGTHSWLNAQAGLRSGRTGAKRITDTRETYDLPTVDVDAFLAARDAERPG
jgi:hypothetical protein